MLILGIETSCDETAASVVEAKAGTIRVLSNIVSSQVKMHAQWGGVVPNLAAREHLKNILPVIDVALKKAKTSAKQLDLLAVTRGPGLMPALLVGANTAKTLSYLWRKPLIGIHHVEGHIYANFLRDDIGANLKIKDQALKKKKAIGFPILCLVVSGGHTQLVLMRSHLQYEIVGQTMDDAAGEAFDKVARILELGYPGGPAIAACAAKNKQPKLPLKLPRPMVSSPNLDFSFSGLKTAVLYAVKKHPELLKNKKLKGAFSAEFQQAVIDVLVAKTLKAAEKYKPQSVMLAGGVSANRELRRQLGTALAINFPKTAYQIPNVEYSLDNAAMIAVAGYFRYKKCGLKMQEAARSQTADPDPNLKIN